MTSLLFALAFLCLQNLSLANFSLLNAPQDHANSDVGLVDLVASLVNRVNQLEIREKAYLERVDKLEAREKGYIKRIDQLEAREKTYRERVNQLESREKMYIERLEHLETREKACHEILEQLEAQERTNENLNDKMKPVEAREKKQKAQMRSHRAAQNVAKISNRSRRQSALPNVAFYAHVGNHKVNLGVDQHIEFDNVYTNIGNAYNPISGIFTAPQPGIYVFSMTLKCKTGHNDNYYMAHNGNSVGELYIHCSVTTAASSSRTAVLQLAQGDIVSVKNRSLGEGVYGQGYSSFAGFLINNWSVDGTGTIVG